MGPRLKETYKIEFDAIDCTGKLSINGISSLMQVIAGNHASALDINYFKLNSHIDRYWIVSRAKYIMDAYPTWGDLVTFETYPGGYDKLYAVRLFDIFGNQGNKIGHIIGNYILMETERNRPIRIKGAGGALECLNFPYEGEKLGKLMPLTEDKLIHEDIRKARYYEMDLNGHMNNSHYIRWAIDLLPMELIKAYEIASFEINYNASVTYNASVRMRLGQRGNGAYVISGDSLDGSQNYFLCEVFLRPRKIAE